MKPNCYNCKYRGSVPGDAHSSCHHPGAVAASDPLSQAMAIFFGSNRQADKPENGEIRQEDLPKKIKVRGSEHGVRNGWFFHPYNFDPAWLVECDGYTPIEENK